MSTTDLTRNNLDSILNTIWEALEAYRENCIPEGDSDYDEQWDDICTAMAWITEDLEAFEND